MFFSKQPAGLIKYLNLTDWWFSTFSEDERKLIVKTFQPIGASSDSLVVGNPTYYSGTAASLLSSLAGWFKKKEERTIAYRIIEEAEKFTLQAEILDRHFLYQSKIQTYYPYRDIDSFALQRATEACEQQIAMSEEAAKAFESQYGKGLPAHIGYYQLSIIREKEGNLEAAIEVSRRALKQGWAGDWDGRIERYEKKLAKRT